MISIGISVSINSTLIQCDKNGLRCWHTLIGFFSAFNDQF